MKLVSKSCEGSEMFLVPQGAMFETTSLHMTIKDGKPIDIPIPTEMKEYTPVGIGCVAATKGSPYFIVQYGELPFGCTFCEWFYLYDAKGNQLTSSLPLIFFDDSLPGEDKKYPNNQEFNELTEKLGLDITAIIDSISFVMCRTTVNDDGTSSCESWARSIPR